MTKPLNQISKYNDEHRFLTDTQKIVNRHLQDRNHVITEEELRNIRVGMMPPPDAENNNPHEEENRQRNSDTDPAGMPAGLHTAEP